MTTLEKLEQLVYHGFKETDKRIEEHRLETDRRLEKHRLETDRRLEEQRLMTDSRLEKERLKTERALRRVARDVAGITDSLGRFAESAVYPAVSRLFRERNIELADTYWRVGDRRNGHHIEVDVLAAGPECVVLIEVKLRLKLGHVKEVLRKLDIFFEVFPYYRGRILYGGVAGMSIEKGVDRFAYKQGLFVLAQTGRNLRILNDETFSPRDFSKSSSHQQAMSY